MNTQKRAMQGALSIKIIVLIALTLIVCVYAYIDSIADSHAEQTIDALISDAEQQGVAISYESIDSSPYSRNVTVKNMKIEGATQEPDIVIGNIVVSGFTWQDVTQSEKTFPLEMRFDLSNAALIIDDEMIGNDPNLQAFVDVMGNKIGFASHAEYKLDDSTGIFTVSIAQAVANNFTFYSNFTFGNAGWLPYVESNETLLSDELSLDLLATTLNGLSLTFVNEGLVEKMRAVSAKQIGVSSEELSQQAVMKLRHIQTALKEYSPVYGLMIEELIKFTQQPNKITFRIAPDQPLVSDDFIKAFQGNNASPFELMQKAKVIIEAN